MCDPDELFARAIDETQNGIDCSVGNVVTIYCNSHQDERGAPVENSGEVTPGDLYDQPLIPTNNKKTCGTTVDGHGDRGPADASRKVQV